MIGAYVLGRPMASFSTRLDQRGLAEAWRRLGEVLGGVQLVQFERLAGSKRGQELVFALTAGWPDSPVAVEFEDLTLRLEDAGPRVNHHVGHHIDGRCHLASDEPRVNELVEPVLVVAQGAFQPVGCEAQVGGPDRFVGLLRNLPAA